ncbi:hypothetical protein [Brevundimonas sp. M20]|uniref:hypothetical protein n=1 Tax=Brevundimonas sp. M20 TaxID=2591463 RepID=UPI0011479E20|nr:hypothetical protein [Brevundimonas sp. M20]QDH73761.1 hypothetical protein FKQ52_10190 [Brevundimonas sp. M20]
MIRSTLMLLVAALSISLSAVPVGAQTVKAEDRAAIQVRIDQLTGLIGQGDLVGAVDVIPILLQDAMAARFGMSRDQIKPAMRQAMAGMLDGVHIDGYGMDLAAAETLMTPTAGRTYLLIPTWTEMTIQGAGRFRADTQTLAIEDGGEWYLIRVEDAPQQALLREVYPEFVGVESPPERPANCSRPDQRAQRAGGRA